MYPTKNPIRMAHIIPCPAVQSLEITPVTASPFSNTLEEGVSNTNAAKPVKAPLTAVEILSFLR